jgi:hypothetical protein
MTQILREFTQYIQATRKEATCSVLVLESVGNKRVFTNPMKVEVLHSQVNQDNARNRIVLHQSRIKQTTQKEQSKGNKLNEVEIKRNHPHICNQFFVQAKFFKVGIKQQI